MGRTEGECLTKFDFSFSFSGYNYSDFIIQEKQILDDAYSSPRISQDSDLADRMRALEAWALSVDSRLKLFDQKLSKLDNIESQIEQYSLMHLQQNLMQILTRDNTDALALKLKAYFDQNYVTPDQLREASLVLNERLANIGQAELDEDRIKEMVQEYLALFERRQLEVIVQKVEEHVKDVEVQRTGSGVDMEAVRTLVAGMLEVYDADKTGLVDYALESAGGQVLSTRCTELYQIKSKQYWVLGVPVLWVHTSPRNALTAGAAPADCWAFQGFPGYLVIKTYAIIEVTGFSLEHMSKLLAIDGKIESAPKNFSVYGLHGELDPEPHLFGDYMYDADGKSIQYFPVKHPKTTNIDGIEYPVAYDIVELRIESNHGNPTYTCVYRFRVHGNPLADVRRAAEDSMHDSQL